MRSSINFKLSYLSVKLIVMIVVILLGWLTYFFINYNKMLDKTVKFESLEKENAYLHSENKKIEKYVQTLNELIAMDKKIKEMVGHNQDVSLSLKSPNTESTEIIRESVVSNNGQNNENKLTTEMQELFNSQERFLQSVPSIWPTRGWITRKFEPMPSAHYGIDIAGREGTPITATADGIVSFAGWDSRFGQMVIIDHGYEYQTQYGHNSQILVVKGQAVRRGTIIAYMGSTGKSSAPHLHYAIKYNSKLVDPLPYLKSGN
jgi:murein DD-endopeptidase MepM/ murein hydrolase activator NlpD